MQPKKIKLLNDGLSLLWDNDKEDILELKYLREECPCAVCKGETVLLHTIKPAKLKLTSPDVFIINNIKPVGGYALQLFWKDGHDTGIYSYEYLLKLAKDQENGNTQNYSTLL